MVYLAFVYLFVCLFFVSMIGSYMKFLPEMYHLTNFGSHPDLDPDLGIF